MSDSLNTLAKQGVITSLSLHFARFVADTCDQPFDSLLALSAALLSERNQEGDVCIDLNQYLNRPIFQCELIPDQALMVNLSIEDWQDYLLQFNCVAEAGQVAPLILDNHRLYLHRFWLYETEVAEAILDRLSDIDEGCDTNRLGNQLDQLYGREVNEQKTAVALSVIRRFAVISGGPGTGKTTTLIHILSLLLTQQADMRIALAAPTGKAATRMMESIQNGLDNSNIDINVRSRIPTRASTIHRLLGLKSRKLVSVQPQVLPLDCVVIDEASMVDLTLMYRLIKSLSTDARIILLGDRDQLASVSAGNVLGDITGHGQSIIHSKNLVQQLEAASAAMEVELAGANNSPDIGDSIALLTHSYRFDGDTGIGKLAKLVNAGNKDAVIQQLQMPDKQIEWLPVAGDRPDNQLFEKILSNYKEVVSSKTIESAFDAFESSRVLCAVHSGPFGEEAINSQIDDTMRQRQWIKNDATYQGKPILITSNDYELNLFNGDIGILWRDKQQHLRAYFYDHNRSLRSLPISSLPDYVSAWAMTVHKSQGSEFDQVILLLPPEGQYRPVSRALLYTGITRARQKLLIHADVPTITQACATTSQRHSGLAFRLGWR